MLELCYVCVCGVALKVRVVHDCYAVVCVQTKVCACAVRGEYRIRSKRILPNTRQQLVGITCKFIN